jgi:hypothetical protein
LEANKGAHTEEAVLNLPLFACMGSEMLSTLSNPNCGLINYNTVYDTEPQWNVLCSKNRVLARAYLITSRGKVKGTCTAGDNFIGEGRG